MTQLEDVVGPAEVAELLGVKRNTLVQWRLRGKLPEPIAEISGIPLWLRSDVETWPAAPGPAKVRVKRDVPEARGPKAAPKTAAERRLARYLRQRERANEAAGFLAVLADVLENR